MGTVGTSVGGLYVYVCVSRSLVKELGISEDRSLSGLCLLTHKRSGSNTDKLEKKNADK
jgi:hypothetical protein